MAAVPPLPANCSACAYFLSTTKDGNLCLRHAPSPASEPVHISETFEVVKWPHVRPLDRCGAGAARLGDNGPGVTRCVSCIHWFQPGGVGVKPDYPGIRSASWWQESGFCMRFAPSPSTEESMHSHWRVTSMHDGCGDGDPVPDTEQEAHQLHPVHEAVNDAQAVPLAGSH